MAGSIMPNGRRASGLAGAAAIAALLLAPAALAAQGGGTGCPWAQDVTLDLGGRSIIIPQSVFDPKNLSPSVDGYELRPSLETLSMQIIGPAGQVWHAALTRVASGKRCTAFYIGPAMPLEDEEAVRRVAEQ